MMAFSLCLLDLMESKDVFVVEEMKREVFEFLRKRVEK